MAGGLKTTLYLVRHAESEAQARNIVQGRGLDVPLTGEGRAQAARLAEALKDIHFDKIYTSHARRARDTAEAVRRYHSIVPFVELPALVERHQGDAEGMSRDDLAERYPEVLAGWRREEDIGFPNGENFAAVHDRVVPVIEEHVAADAKGQTYLYVIHGNVIKVLLGHMLQVPHGLRPRIKQDYCAINVCTFDHDRQRWNVECVNKAL